MKVLRVLRQCVLGLAVLSLAACSSDDETATDAQLKEQALQIVGQMSTRDKIGQKIMMAFRYWCEPPADSNCTDRRRYCPTLPPARCAITASAAWSCSRTTSYRSIRSAA
uniref:Lipoprotein n=1 Tax=blood disease bacterium R229 TaxID=741978 RepID=G2ZUT0_9RALS|nr:exported hypothetical protein [blood disease bacterium R229]